jgi:16S rRNA (guanine966-N2)-methyltransferase
MNGKIRIIAGQWRGRKLQVPDKPGLRPTPNRVRETLFNWLAMRLPNSRCLDLFAGSGALGIEAASRGAKSVLLVEKQRDIVQSLRQQVAGFASDNLEIIGADAIQWLKTAATPFNIVFLDPPYDQPDLLSTSCTLLEQRGWLESRAYIYLETERRFGEPNLPASWQIIRQQIAGQVAGFLAERLVEPS